MQGSLSDTALPRRPFGSRAALARAAKPSANPAAAARSNRYLPVMIHAVFFLVVLVVWLVSESPATMLYVGGVLGGLTYVTLAIIEMRRAPLLASPLSAIFLWTLPPVSASAIHHAYKIMDGEPMRYSIRPLYPDDLAAGYLIIILGHLSFHLGVQWTRPLVSDSQGPENLGTPRPWALFALWMAGMGSRFAARYVAALGAISGVLHFTSTAALAAYLLSADPRRRGLSFWFILIIGTGFEFATNLSSGSKAYLMFSFLPVLWLFIRDKKLRRFLPALSAGMVVLYLGVIAPVIMASRSGRIDARESKVDRILRVYTEGDYEEDAGTDKQFTKYLERVFDATAAGCIHGEVEKTGYMYGEGLDYLVYAFVPRAIWPDKPSVTRGAWFTAYLGQARSEDSATTSLGQTAAGELYWNFSWLGVMFGMSILGSMVGKLWRLATPFAEKDAMRLLLYLAVTLQVIHMAEAGSTFVALVYRAIILGLPVIVLDRIRRAAALARVSNRKPARMR